MMDSVKNIFGSISPPPGPIGIYGDPLTGMSKVIAFGIRTMLIVGSMFTLVYFLWGSFDMITASGDPERLTKARKKIINAFVGIIVMVLLLTLFTVITGDLMGLYDFTNGIIFNVPRL